jgi:hypothetical protein
VASEGQPTLGTTVQVNRAALAEARVVDTAMADLADNAVRLRIESFAVTANNVTYAVVGDAFGYWNFFPGEGEWGVVPMWGHAVVQQSRHPDIIAGERVYGYLPMATHLDVSPAGVTPGGFVDAAPHRQPMSAIYNQYSRLAADPEHDPEREAERMIFGPLFKTGYLIEDMFRRQAWYGAEAVIMTSASSKTSMALASVARDKSPRVQRVGLTSGGNVEFVRASGFYDTVLSYDAIGYLPTGACVLVDFAGNAGLLHALHTALEGRLRYSCTVGATHVGAGFGQVNGPISGPQPVLFFAPDHATAAIKEHGPKAFSQAVAASWATFVAEASDAIAVDERAGLESARSAFSETLAGRADPAKGVVIRP